MKDQSIEIPLKPGSRLTMYNNGGVFYAGVVEQYVPDTGLLVMNDGKSLSEIKEMIEGAKRVEITYE